MTPLRRGSEGNMLRAAWARWACVRPRKLGIVRNRGKAWDTSGCVSLGAATIGDFEKQLQKRFDRRSL